MDYILRKLDDNLMLNEHLDDKYNLLKYHQARSEYILVLLLSYLWNKNFNKDKISHDDKFKIFNSISNSKFTVGSLIKVIEWLDVENDVISTSDDKKILEHYRDTRNEEIGHGFVFSDATDNLISEFQQLHQKFSTLKTEILFKDIDIILVIQEESNLYKGIKFKSDGAYSVWTCPKANYKFQKDDLYAQISENGLLTYLRLSPFIGFERKGGTNIDYYIFAKINNPLTGGATYNYLSKSGKNTELEWPELINSGIISDGNILVSKKNNTTANYFNPNYKDFIDVGITKKDVIDFITKNEAQISANLWGHGGVGKTAVIQRVIDEFLNSEIKHFKYILFLSAKNTIFNKETGTTESIESDRIISDYETLIKTIYSIIFRDNEFDFNQQEQKIKDYNEGKTLLVIDDYESFNNTDKERIIKFINNLKLEYFKVIITTRSSAEITGSIAIPINELDPNKTRIFFVELVKNDENIPQRQKDEVFGLLNDGKNIKQLHFITDGRPLFIEYLKNILLRIDIKEAFGSDIKSSKEAIKFLYGKIYDYLSPIAKKIFISIGQMTFGDDLSLLIEHVRFVSNNENDEDIDRFKKAIRELEDYKIIKTDESQRYIKLWAIEVIEPMKFSFSSTSDLDLKSLINQRVILVKENIKSESIPEVFFQEAEKIRLDGLKTEAVVEAAYKRVINTKESTFALKSEALYKLGTYLISQGNLTRAIKVYSEYEKLFGDDPIFIKRFSYICYGSKEIIHRNKSIQILLDFINTRNNHKEIPLSTKLEIYGIVIMRKNTYLTFEIDEIRNKQLIGIISKKVYEQSYSDYLNQLKQINKREGFILYNELQKYELQKLSKNEKHYIYNGIYHYVDVCLKLKLYKTASELCDFVLKNAPEAYHKQFANYYTKIPSLNNSHAKIVSKTIVSAKLMEIKTEKPTVTCVVNQISEKIVFVILKETNEKGTLYIDEISSKFICKPLDIFSIGQEIELFKIGQDFNNNISLSLRKIECQLLHVSQTVKCKIIQVREKSAFAVIIGKSLVGEIYVKYIANEYVKDVNDYLKVGEEKLAEVVSLSDFYGIGLSLLDVKQD